MIFGKWSSRGFLCVLLLAAGCAPAPSAPLNVGNFNGTTYPNIGSYTSNSMTVYVNDTSSSGCGTANGMYVNQPCVSVTICSPANPNQCQTINDILLDTGSYGLRIFSSVITVPLVPITSGSEVLSECMTYGDGSSEFGPVEYAYVKMAGEPGVAMPIEVINPNFGNMPGPCTSAQSIPDTSPAEARFNGILGLGLGNQDCGSYCVTNSDSQIYYTCNPSSTATGGYDCTAGATVALAAQVANPAALLPTDNNGIVLTIPSVTSGGQASVDGTLYFGIATRANNTPSGNLYKADPSAFEFYTKFNAYSSTTFIPAFLDTGTNTLDLPPDSGGSLVDCTNSAYVGFFCPSSNYSGSAIASSCVNKNPVSPQTTETFTVGNAYNLLHGTSYYVFGELGTDAGTGSSAVFDWGLPFFFGRTVAVGITGKSALGTTGPFWVF